MDGRGKVPHGVERTFEADPPKLGSVRVRGLLHQEPDQVVGNHVHERFLGDKFRALAAQDIEAEQYLDLMEVKFDFPALRVERADGIGGVGNRVGQCRHQGYFPRAKPGRADMQADESQ